MKYMYMHFYNKVTPNNNKHSVCRPNHCVRPNMRTILQNNDTQSGCQNNFNSFMLQNSQSGKMVRINLEEWGWMAFYTLYHKAILIAILNCMSVPKYFSHDKCVKNVFMRFSIMLLPCFYYCFTVMWTLRLAC